MPEYKVHNKEIVIPVTAEIPESAVVSYIKSALSPEEIYGDLDNFIPFLMGLEIEGYDFSVNLVMDLLGIDPTIRPKEKPKVHSFLDPLYRDEYSTYVGPKLSDTNLYCFVGEQPGSTEVREHEPFVGSSGILLTRCMVASSIARSECYMTNVIKDFDAPIENYIRFQRGEAILSDSGRAYIESLIKEINSLDPAPKCIVAVGGVALYALTGRIGIYNNRGSVLEPPNLPCPVVPIIHPATVLPPKNVYLNRHLILYDLKRSVKVMQGFRPRKRNLIIRPTFDEVLEFIEKCHKVGKETDTTIFYDLECLNEEVSCISLSYDSDEAMCIHFVDEEGDVFTPPKELQVWLALARIMEDSEVRMGGQNIVFDAQFLLHRYGIKFTQREDTMIAQHISMPDFSKGLDFIASIHTDVPYYKDDGKEWFNKGKGNIETLWKYNDKDSIVCSEAFPKQLEDLASQNNISTYVQQRRLVNPLTYMMERGIRVDVEGLKKKYEDLKKEEGEVCEEINKLAGRELNPRSTNQLKEYFYDELKIKPYKKRTQKGWVVTTDELAMKRIARRGFPVASLILKARHLRKIATTYADINKVDPDGRIRCSYDPVGTRFSRLSSSKNIFGTGTNLQNWPHDLLEYLLADPGYIIYNIDLAQAENRIVAYVGQVLPMIHAFETGKDMHSLTGALISGLDYEEVKRQHYENIYCDLGGKDKTWRFWGKKGNHGLNYDLSHKQFALRYEIPENDGLRIVDGYHDAYPQVRNIYHKDVQRMIKEDRAITNLMGRTCPFLGALEDKTYKIGYSCIPQGTVGDIINERGLNYVYYDQDNFKPIELLTQVHDSIAFQVPLSVPLIEHARMLIKIKKSLEVTLSTHGRDFIIPADLTVGFTLGKSGTELKGTEFSEDENILAMKLQSIAATLQGRQYGESAS
jgi:uracil-DNA glycosylase family 4